MAITAVLFDAGEVLYHRPRRRMRLREFLAELALDDELRGAKADDAASLKRASWTGAISPDEYHRGMLRLWGVYRSEDVQRGLRLWESIWPDIEMRSGVVDTLLKLRSRGFLLGVVTNTLNTTAEKLRWFSSEGLPPDLWSSFSTSCELGVVKPDPAIYRHALSELDRDAAEVYFVGHAQDELDGAAAVGMTTIGYNRDHASVTADIVIEEFDELLDRCGRLSGGLAAGRSG